MTTRKRYDRAANLTAWARTSNIAVMSIAPSPADLDGDVAADKGLVEMERELIRLLIEYDELKTAWPKGGHVLVRARIGKRGSGLVSCIMPPSPGSSRRGGKTQDTRPDPYASEELVWKKTDAMPVLVFRRFKVRIHNFD